jgi:hypothetical protein
VRKQWDPDELIEAWTLVEADWELVGNKTGTTRLGFSLILKFYELERRFPACAEEVPTAVVKYVASLVKVGAALFAKYSWRGRTIKYHRAQIRKAYGTRPASEADEERWAQWLADEVCPVETDRGRLADAVRQRCHSERVEPPAEGQLERVVASAVHQFEEAFAAGVAARLNPVGCGRLEDLIGKSGLLAELESDPGATSPGRTCGPRSPAS